MEARNGVRELARSRSLSRRGVPLFPTVSLATETWAMNFAKIVGTLFRSTPPCPARISLVLLPTHEQFTDQWRIPLSNASETKDEKSHHIR
jgi:hypothetical protein